jgi:hypothetical protein
MKLEPERLVTAGLAVATMCNVAVPSGSHGDQSRAALWALWYVGRSFGFGQIRPLVPPRLSIS